MARIGKKGAKKTPKKKPKPRRREYEEREQPSPLWKRLVADQPWWEIEETEEFELTATTKGGTPADRRR